MLSNNQKSYCQNYVENGNNQTQAYLKAYKTCKNEDSARKNASRMMTKVDIQEYIAELQKELKSVSIMNAKERMEYLTKIISGIVKHTTYDGNGGTYENEAYISDKMKAIDLLNKMDGQYTENIMIEDKTERTSKIDSLIDSINIKKNKKKQADADK